MKRRSREEWLWLLHEGMSCKNLAHFCREKGIARDSFYRWRKKLASMSTDGGWDAIRATKQENQLLRAMLADALVRIRQLERELNGSLSSDVPPLRAVESARP